MCDFVPNEIYNMRILALKDTAIALAESDKGNDRFFAFHNGLTLASERLK